MNSFLESVKFVHEKGPSIEGVIKEQSPPTVQKGVSKPKLKLVPSKDYSSVKEWIGLTTFSALPLPDLGLPFMSPLFFFEVSFYVIS